MDLKKGPVYPITEEQAHRNLWTQVILGDKATDNIPGLSHAATYKNVNKKFRGSRDDLWGEVRAKELLDTTDPENYAQKILTEYVDAYQGHDIPGGLETEYQCFGEYRFHETFDLIHMLLKAPDNVKISYETRDIQKEAPNEFITN